MKNNKTTMGNILLLLLGTLIFIFLSQPYSASKLGTASGYKMIDFSPMPFAQQSYSLLAVSNLLVCILTGLIMLIAIYNLLVNFGVIKGQKANTVLQLINLFLSVLLEAFSICAICAIGYLITLPLLTGVAIGWACIVNLVLSILIMLICLWNLINSFISSKTARKKA